MNREPGCRRSESAHPPVDQYETSLNDGVGINIKVSSHANVLFQIFSSEYKYEINCDYKL